MPWFQARNFFDSFRPVYLATKICLMQFETLDFKQQTVRRTLLDQVRFTVAVLVDLGLIYRSITVNTPYLRLTDSVLLNVGSYMTLVLLTLLTSSVPAWNRYKSMEMLEIYTNINDCDRALESLGIFIDHRKQHKIGTLYLIAWMSVPVIITITAALARLNKAWTSVSSTGPDLITVVAMLRTSSNFSLFICYSTLVVLSINERFGCVQKAMEKYVELTASSQSTVSCAVIRRIASAHDQLSDTVQLLNNCYSFHLMQTVTMSVFSTVFFVFGLIHAYATDASDAMMQVARNNIVYCGFYVLIFGLMTVFTSLVGKNCKRVATAMHKAVCYGSYDQRVFRELRWFSQQLKHHSPMVGCGLLDFDWTLIYSAAGTFATYLVILLQFDVGNLGFHRHQ